MGAMKVEPVVHATSLNFELPLLIHSSGDRKAMLDLKNMLSESDKRSF